MGFSMDGGLGKDKAGGWLYLMLPFQIAYSTLSSLIILYILDLHGNVIDASYAVTLANALGMVASLFWGDIIDRYNRRRVFVSLSFASLSLSLLGFFFTRSVMGVILIYGALAFMLGAVATPLSLLVMETNRKRRWAEGFSRLQMFSSIGSTLGFAFVFLLSGLVSTAYLILLLIPFSLAALALTLLIRDPRRALTGRSILESVHAFRGRLLMLHVFFLRPPSSERIRDSARRLRALSLPKKNTLNALFLATLVFSIGTTIFNTSYIAGLRYKGLNNFDVLFIMLLSFAVQAIVFRFSGALAERRAKSRVTTSYLLWRGGGYIAIGVTFALFGPTANLAAGLIFYPIAAGIAYAIVYTALSTMVFEAIGNKRKGRKLGLYSGYSGFGSLIGAPLAGYISYYVGFWFAFVASGVLIFITAYIIIRLPKLSSDRVSQHNR